MSVDKSYIERTPHACVFCGHTAPPPQNAGQDGVKWYEDKGYRCNKAERCRIRMRETIDELRGRVPPFPEEGDADL